MKPLGNSPSVCLIVYGSNNIELTDVFSNWLKSNIPNIAVVKTIVCDGCRPNNQELTKCINDTFCDLICLFSNELEVLRLNWETIISHFQDEDCFAVTGPSLHHDAIFMESEKFEPIKNLRGGRTTVFDFSMGFCFVRRQAFINYKINEQGNDLDNWARTLVQQGLHFMHDPGTIVTRVRFQPSPTPSS